MKIKDQYQGVIVPMLTPVTDDGRVDLEAAARIAERIISAGSAVFVLGTTGECPSLDRSSKIEMVQAVVRQNAGRRPVYAGISDNCLANSIDLAHVFTDIGVDGAFAHVPGFYPLDDDDVFCYYQRLADNCPLPLFIYNIPSLTNTCPSLDVIDRLSHHQRIVGLKDSSNDQQRLKMAVERWKGREDFVHLTGSSALSAMALSLGSDGIVPGAGNIFPGLFCKLYEAVCCSNMDLANLLQSISDRISTISDRGRYMGQSLAVLKAMMSIMGLCSPNMLPPLRPLAQGQIDQLRPILAQIQELLAQI